MFTAIGCTTYNQATSNTNFDTISTKNLLEGTWVLKYVLMGDAMDKPCGFVNEGKVKEMSLTFTSEKLEGTDQIKLHGQSSVNNFMGSYTILYYDENLKTGKIKFSQLASTKMAAVNPNFMDCETRYLSYLESSEDFKIVDGKLQLIKSTPLPNNGNGNIPFGESYKNVLYFDKK
jgi:hypothetical protein